MALLTFTAVAVGLFGCGDDNGEEPAAIPTPTEQRQQVRQPKPTTTQRSPRLTAATADSGIEGVPIPASAKPSGEGVWTVPGADYLEVVDWYEDQMPEGQDFGSWAWCDTGGGAGVSASEAIHGHIYARVGREILGVSIANEEPVEIIIGADQSGPC